MNVLVSACACIPGRGSEPGIGWNWVQQIASYNSAWVLTREKHRQEIEAALAKDPLFNAHFVYIKLPFWLESRQKGERWLRLFYFLWQLKAYFVARKLHREHEFALVHHVTWSSYWMPTFMALLPIPFLWGPVGGAECTPAPFRNCFGRRARIPEIARDLARFCAELNPLLRYTVRRAALVFATTDSTRRRIQDLGGNNVQTCASVGLPAQDINSLGELPGRTQSPFRVLSLGRLVHWKGFEFGLRAFAELLRSFPNSEYWLIGDGPARQHLEQLAHKLKIANNVTFWGGLSRQEGLAKLSQCDALIFPTLHDSGGWASLESMAAGKPVICLDLGGPALQVTEETGIKLPARCPKQVIADLAASLELLAREPGYRLRLGSAARIRVRKHFSWDSKGLAMAQIYNRYNPLRSQTLSVMTNSRADSAV